jgi:hypothetical protein
VYTKDLKGFSGIGGIVGLDIFLLAFIINEIERPEPEVRFMLYLISTERLLACGVGQSGFRAILVRKRWYAIH